MIGWKEGEEQLVIQSLTSQLKGRRKNNDERERSKMEKKE